MAELRERREVEVSLLKAMFPDAISWSATSQELSYRSERGHFLVRLSDEYPGIKPPLIISAITKDKTDVRDKMAKHADVLQLSGSEEMLDALIQAFDDIIVEKQTIPGNSTCQVQQTHETQYKTVVIWLHHLLNTNKRKLALTPSVAASEISGITRPGYPGVLVYSGSSDVVDEHVRELKGQRWQAFQIRLEEITSKPWEFSHTGIQEVESLSEVSQRLVDSQQREAVLKCIGVK